MRTTAIRTAAACLLLAGCACASPIDLMPQVPGPDKRIEDYTVQDVIGCVFGQNTDQPDGHPLRAGDPPALLKARWPGAKAPASLDPILSCILLADSPTYDDRIGQGIYWLLYEVMDVPKAEMGASFARVYAAQTEQAARRKVAFLGFLLFPYLADERVLSAMRDMLADPTVYKTIPIEEGPAIRITVRVEALYNIKSYFFDPGLLRMGLPKGKCIMGEADLQVLRANQNHEEALCNLQKAWLDENWDKVLAKCAEVRAKPDSERSFPGHRGRRILAPLPPRRP